MKDNIVLHFLKVCSLLVLLLLTALSYHPMFSSFVTDCQDINPLKKYIYLMMAVTFFLHIGIKSWLSESFIRNYFKWVLLIVLWGLIFVVFWDTTDYFGESKNVMIALMFILIGYNAKLKNNELLIILISYSVMILYCVYCQIVSNFGGFIIADTYMQYGKNTLGVMTSSSCVAMGVVAISLNKKYYCKICLWGIALLLLFFTITIRARAAFIVTIFLILYILYRKFKDNSNLKSLVVVVFISLILGGVFLGMLQNLWDYIFDSFTQNQSSDLTSGRMSRNLFAIEIIAESPLFGNLITNYTYEWIHNYALRQLSSYGILGSFPLMGLYVSLVVFVVKNVIKRKLTLLTLGYFVFMVPVIISWEEPTFPYAPGTGAILPFVLMGYSLFKQKDELQKCCVRCHKLPV